LAGAASRRPAENEPFGPRRRIRRERSEL